MNTLVKITVSNGSMQGKEFAFDRRKTSIIGRARDCDITLPDIGENLDVSRRHCLLRVEPPRAWLRDLNSRNGTFVNDRKISTYEFELQEGDEIRLGHVIMKVEMTEQETSDLIASAYADSEWIT